MTCGFDIKGKIADGPPIVPLKIDNLPKTAFPVVTIPEPNHALATFLGVLLGGQIAGIATQNMVDTLPKGIAFPVSKMMARVGNLQGFAQQFLTFTGGATGAPKMILRSPQSWIYSFERMGVGADDKVACFGNLSHSIALYSALEAIHNGAEFHPLSKVPIRQWAEQLIERQITCLYATPTQIRLLMALAPSACTTVNKVFIGGGNVDAFLISGVRNIFPLADVRGFYGAAETSFVAVSDADTPEGSIGRPFDGVSLSIDNQRCIFAKGPMLFDGYATPPNTPAETIDGSVCVGDLGEMRGGYLYLLGRNDRVVTISDMSIPLDRVEEALRTHPNVMQAAVLTRTDSLRGLGLYALVQTRDGTGYIGNIDGYMPSKQMPKIRKIIRMPNWPVTAGGKTEYNALQVVLDKHP